jgi:anion-transporting  ArsA/GET3 family ATPase
VFFRALGGMIDGFTDRARRVEALLSDPATTFLIVTSPQHEPVEEAIYFHRKLSAARMPFGGVLVNRVHEAPAVDGDLPELAKELGDKLAARVGTSAREVAALAARDEDSIEHLRRSLGDPPTIVVPELDDDVHDVEGLAVVLEYLYAGTLR